MTRVKTLYALLWFWLPSLALLLLTMPLHAEPSDPVVVVVNPNIRSEILKLTNPALPAIFAMRVRTWPNNTQIRVFVLEGDSPVHTAFCKQILGILPHLIRTAWDRLIYSGTGQGPTEVDSEQEMLQRVATTPGAIGYLRQSMVNDSVSLAPELL